MILGNGDPFHAHSKGKARPFLRINLTIRQYRGINHAAAHNLNPAGMFTNRTAFTLAKGAGNIHFRAGLGERKKARPETGLNFRPEKLFYESIQGSLEMAEINAFIQ